MKVTYPHLGNLFLAINALLQGLGCEIIPPPPSSKRTLSLGTQIAPESACLPLKINLGNYLEALELGADTLVMVGGVGPCRIGYYGQVQEQILRDLEKNFKMVVLEPPDAHFREVWDKIGELKQRSWTDVIKGINLAWHKIYAADQIEMKLEWLRPRLNWNSLHLAEQIYEKAIKRLDQIQSRKEIKILVKETFSALQELPHDPQQEIIKIGLVGEVYMLLEPFANLDLEKHLGRLGVEVERAIYLSQWINDHLFGSLLPVPSSKYLKERARPFLNHFVGGHGRESVGGAVEFAKRGFDGVIQIGPLTCMPEIVAQSILPSVSEAYGIPIMTIYIDEHSGEAGLITRLEAFVDLIRQKKLTQGKKEWIHWKSI